ncbi:hypothetical protein BGZ93_007457 [Podila epicladia]|nr:hypothetical protein BGZ92_000920 [Podila epicladia]KAG0094234.1 hypothetical protein BGZ93_007457 [Podila epicladia]
MKARANRNSRNTQLPSADKSATRGHYVPYKRLPVPENEAITDRIHHPDYTRFARHIILAQIQPYITDNHAAQTLTLGELGRLHRAPSRHQTVLSNPEYRRIQLQEQSAQLRAKNARLAVVQQLAAKHSELLEQSAQLSAKKSQLLAELALISAQIADLSESDQFGRICTSPPLATDASCQTVDLVTPPISPLPCLHALYPCRRPDEESHCHMGLMTGTRGLRVKVRMEPNTR